MVAIQRRTPTRSPRNTIDSTVTKIGDTKLVVVASAIGRKRSALMKISDEPTSVSPRSTCRPGRTVRSASRGDIATTAGHMISMKVR